MRKSWLVIGAIVLLLIGGAVGWAIRGDGDTEATTVAVETTQTDTTEQDVSDEVTRELLASTDAPDGLEDLDDPRTLSLARITIPPGVTLPWHYHDGTQIAQVVEGTLTYEVREGKVEIWAGTSEDDAEVVRTVSAGGTAQVGPGEWLVEQPSSVHRGSNNTDKPVRILATTLLLTGASPSTPVD